MMIQRQRELFSLAPDLHYLDGAYMSPLMREVEAAGVVGLSRRRDPSELGPDFYFDDVSEARSSFARLIACDEPRRIAVLPGVAYGMAVAARNVRVSAGDNVVVAEELFPSGYYAWSRKVLETGAELRRVPRPAGASSMQWSARIAEAVDSHTAALVIEPLDRHDGMPLDLELLNRAARRVDAAFVIDASQHLGALPFSVTQVRADAVLCAAYKWLFGPLGMALGYFGERFDGGVPIEDTWLGRVDEKRRASVPHRSERYEPFAQRYDASGRNNLVFLPMVVAGLRRVNEWTPAAIQAYCRDLLRTLASEVSALGCEIASAGEHVGHILEVRLPRDISGKSIAQYLKRECNVVVSGRRNRVRLSLSVYNGANDVEAFVLGLKAALFSTRGGNSPTLSLSERDR